MTNQGDGILVAGLIMRFVFKPHGIEETFGGPALAAAAGMTKLNVQPTILASISDDVSIEEFKLAKRLAGNTSLLHQLKKPCLTWRGPRIVGEQDSWELKGTPMEWCTALPRQRDKFRTLVLANADPKWWLEIIQNTSSQIVCLDLDATWGDYRTDSILRCLEHSHLITITHKDYDSISNPIRRYMSESFEGVIVIKSGDLGVEVNQKGKASMLPPPELTMGIKSDVGAGDVLIGTLAALIHQQASLPTIESVCSSYMRARGIVGQFLISGDLNTFIGIHSPSISCR